MQVKKDKINERLMCAAQEIFMEKGFESASIRSIVRAANTTIGNFYNYYESKEALFSALVDDVYTQFVQFIQNHQNDNTQHDFTQTPKIHTWRAQLDTSVKAILPMITDRFLLLINNSAGTRYEGAKQQFVNLLSSHFDEHIAALAPNYPYPEIGHIIAAQCVDGIAAILTHTANKTKREQLIVEQLFYTSAGIYTLLLGENHD